MRKLSLFLSCTLALAIAGCDKNELPVDLDFTETAKLKINYASAYAANPLVQLKINDSTVSSPIRYAYPFPGGGLNTQGGSQPDYLAVRQGAVKVGLSIPKVDLSADSVALYSTNFNIADNDYYSLHIADTGANTQSVLIKENIATPDSGFSSYRFVNLIPNLPAADLYFNNIKVASNIPYMGASDYFNITFPTASSWAIRPAGAAPTSTAIASYTNTTPNQRVFVVFARGYVGIPTSDVNRRPSVSLYYLR